KNPSPPQNLVFTLLLTPGLLTLFFLRSTDSPSKDRLVFFLLPQGWTSDKVAVEMIFSWMSDFFSEKS
ncbi:MAG TPA: hypothetical protein PKD96_04615, partial [Candidatus Absconditabacterales bacterium]|nr:hypothetical protein [Candidatus Absconditabacterales bacterium]